VGRTARYIFGWVIDVALTYVTFLALSVSLGVFTGRSEDELRIAGLVLLAACTFGVLPWLRWQRRQRARPDGTHTREPTIGQDSGSDDFDGSGQ
jgi:hypothetical protein